MKMENPLMNITFKSIKFHIDVITPSEQIKSIQHFK